MMEPEYDFSRAERGKFYREDVIFKVPIYLADEVVEFFAKRAEAKGVELSELLNDVLRQDIALLEKMQ
ncbi:hypothetical protein [Nodularia spumigena]|jgi:hypothetical protein|uniref:hypothetical protein n=1 Tax=Nodularia spumigena TaxID=70799 RepID=UPI00232DABE6|nr:hypothetical protein [Nodularia spumigena]MDB9317608.1 hypothetical protein [Nodularia spumigena CS-590/01A]MDB9328488.1 hypothetical protein [Nodularia spumigena CS-590/02]MDB9337213.1 hypothetical protein [Nodularia spumigena CS-590/01]